jgi:hypothetical protein
MFPAGRCRFTRTFMRGDCRKLGVVFLLCVAAVAQAQEESRRVVVGRYYNPAEGFSVRVPRGLRAIAGDEAGPERGVMIRLGENRKIVVYGEPNSLEWKDAAEAVRSAVGHEGPDAGKARVFPVRLGSLAASRAAVRGASRDVEVAVAFRPGGSPVYWVRLESDRSHFPRDRTTFVRVVRSFRLEAWK